MIASTATTTEGEATVGPYQGATVQVVDQALVVLKSVCDGTEPRGVRELSRDLGFSKSTVQRILSSLHTAGLVSLDEISRRYTVGPATLTLSWQYLTSNNLVAISSGIADALAAKTGETISVSTMTANKRVTIYEAESPQQLRLTTGVGRPHSLLTGATSRILLSLLTKEERERAMEAAAAEYRAAGEEVPVDLASLEKSVEAAGAEGRATTRGEWLEGSVGIAVPIGRRGEDLAVIGIYGPEFRMPAELVEEFTSLLKEAAATINMAWRS